MKQIVCNNRRNNNMDSKPFSVFLRILFALMFLTSANIVQAQSCKHNTGYLLQKVEPLTHYFYIPFKYGYILPYFYGYFVVDDETLQNFLNQDTVIIEQAIMLCDPTNEMFADSTIVKEVRRFTRIKDILLLDDSEIYRIGQEMYLIRKIRYAYYDNAQVNVYIRNSAAEMWDDIQDEDTVELNKIYEVGQLYERDYYQCFHHLIEILPTPPQISKHLWRRLYQLGEEKTKNN